MHPRLQQYLLNAGLDFDTPPADTESWRAFLRLLHNDYAARQGERRPPPDTEPAVEQSPFEQRVCAERDRMKAVLAALDKGVCVFDLQGRLLLLNGAAKKYLGDMQPMTGDSVLARFEVHDPWSGDLMTAPLLLQLIKEGSNLRDPNAALLREEAQGLPVLFTLRPLLSKRHVIGAVLVFEDICEQKQVEAALLAAKEAAEKASTAKSEFMTSMSHELRTPMNAILGYGDIILDELDDAPPECDPDLVEELHAAVGNILRAGRTLLDLINGVLDLSRLESGKLDICMETLNLAALVAERLGAHHEAINNAGLTLINQATDHTPISVLADTRHLSQVIDSLLSNAIKYNREKGSITVLFEHVSPEKVKLLIKDTGIGMSAEQQAQIFQPFVRMSGRNLSVGTGVGLTLSKHLLETMDGRIGVTSEPDKGSTFWIQLPVAHAAATVPPGLQEASRKFLLLYIEDSRTNVSLVAKILKSRPDIGMISAPSGEMGVELAHTHRPDVILLDINLPGIDGFEVLKRVQAMPELNTIPVIGLSADDSREALQQAEAAGFYRYMIKPLHKDKFLEAVNTVLEGSRK